MLQKPIFFYDNLLKKHTVTVTSEAAGFPKENLFDDYLHALWKATSSANQRISIDAGADVAVDCFFLGNKHNLKTVNATVTLQHSTTGAWGGEEIDAFTGFIPATDNSYQYKLFTSVSKRYWSILLSGMTGVPQIGEAAFGARFDLPYNFADGFDDRAKKVEKNVNVSGGGQKETIAPFKRRYFPCSLLDIPFGSQYETDILAWRDAIEEGAPFWFLWDPGSGTRDIMFVTAEFPGDDLKSRIEGEYRGLDFTLEEEL